MTAAFTTALDGVTVVALATNIPGPLAAARLRAMGARVVKIEPPRGDALALASPSWYAEIHEQLDVVRLDLRDDAGTAALHDRLSNADVLLTAMRGAALARLGLDWKTVHARYPRLSHVAVVGEAAPHDDRAGHDLTYQARAGLLAPPALPRTVLADLAAAERAVSAALAALLQRARTGSGSRVEIAIVDSAVAFAAPLRHGLTGPRDVLGGALDAYNLYRSSDGWVAVAALEPHFAERLKKMLGIDTLDAVTLNAALGARNSQTWEREAAAHDVPLAAVSL
jgi:alpha-methylacyl-CoA racemase